MLLPVKMPMYICKAISAIQQVSLNEAEVEI
jgi:hypothetical protein